MRIWKSENNKYLKNKYNKDTFSIIQFSVSFFNIHTFFSVNTFTCWSVVLHLQQIKFGPNCKGRNPTYLPLLVGVGLYPSPDTAHGTTFGMCHTLSVKWNKQRQYLFHLVRNKRPFRTIVLRNVGNLGGPQSFFTVFLCLKNFSNNIFYHFIQ